MVATVELIDVNVQSFSDSDSDISAESCLAREQIDENLGSAPKKEQYRDPLEDIQQVESNGCLSARALSLPGPVARILHASGSRSRTLASRRLIPLQQFEGTVEGFESGIVSARIQDITDESNPIERVELSVEEFSVSEQRLLEPGAMFYWFIGYETREGGQRSRISEFQVRRMPKFSKRMIKHLEKHGTALYKRFGNNGQEHTTST